MSALRLARGYTGRPKLIIDPNPSTYGQDKEGYDRGPRMTYLNPGPFYHVATFNTAVMAMAQGSHGYGWIHRPTTLSLIPGTSRFLMLMT